MAYGALVPWLGIKTMPPPAVEWQSPNHWTYRKSFWVLCPLLHVALVVKNRPAHARDIEDASLIPGSGRPPGGGNGNPLQYSRLENAMDRGAQRVTVHGVEKIWTWLNNWVHTHVMWWINQLLLIWIRLSDYLTALWDNQWHNDSHKTLKWLI